MLFSVLRYYDKGYDHMLCVSECYLDAEVDTCSCLTATQKFYQYDGRECGGVDMIMCPLDPAGILGDCFRRPLNLRTMLT